jgi:hypothetical protein
MPTIELSDDELGVLRTCVEVYLAELGHEEQDRVNVVQRVYRKLGGSLSKGTERS